VSLIDLDTTYPTHLLALPSRDQQHLRFLLKTKQLQSQGKESRTELISHDLAEKWEWIRMEEIEEEWDKGPNSTLRSNENPKL